MVYKTFDLFALGGSQDWSTDFKNRYDKIRMTSEKVGKDFEANRVLNTKSTLPIESYVGKYTSPLYGFVEITVNGSQLTVNANNFTKATLEHWHYDTFRGWFEKKWYGKTNATFILGADGKISAVNFEGIEFKKNR